MTQIRKAVVLAAGLGQRLQPITKTYPKPLLPFMGVPILAHVLRRLAQAGISQVATNTHHLPHAIEAHLQAHPPQGLHVHLSFEPQILGTGGVYRPLSAWRQGDPILVHNADIITDIPLDGFLDLESTPCLAAMGLLSQANPTEKNQLWVKEGRVASIGEQPPQGGGYTAHGFSCIHALSPTFLREIERGTGSGVIAFYQQALIEKKEVRAVSAPYVFWADIGTPQAYLQAHEDFFQLMEDNPIHPWVQLIQKSFQEYGFSLLHDEERNGSIFYGYNLLHDSVEVKAGSQIGPRTVLTEDCELCENVKVSHSVLFPRVKVKANTTLSRALVAPEACLSFSL